MDNNLNKLIIDNTKTDLDHLMGQVQESDLSKYLCYYWAYVFYKIYGGKLCSIKIKPELKNERDIENIYEHAFVKKNDVLFDSRYLNGINSLQDFLPNTQEFNLNDYTLKEYDNDTDFLNDWQVLDQKEKYDKTITKIKKALAY